MNNESPSPTPTVINLGAGENKQINLPGRNWFNPKMFFLLGGFLVLLVGLGIGTFLVTRPKSQDIGSKAAGAGKAGCSDTCSGDPPSCSGDTTNGTSCSQVSVSGMPDNFDIWALDDSAHQANTKCTIRSGATADCTCDVPGGMTYCWMPLTYLAKNADNQGRRFYMLIYDKATNALIGGSKTEYVGYLDNSSKQTRWGYDTGHDGTWIVQNCGQRKEYHEEADLYGPGSWIETGNILYAEAAGCTTTVGCNQTCNGTTILCSSPYTCTGGKCVNPSCPTTQDSSCVCPPPPPQGTAACQMVSSDPPDLSKVKIGDVVTFTGYGITSDDIEQIDKINFIISTPSGTLSDTIVPAVRDKTKDTNSGGRAWKGIQAFTVPGPGSFSVKIRVHWVSKNQWME